jgi:hypothetical protein
MVKECKEVFFEWQKHASAVQIQSGSLAKLIE